MTIKIKAPGAWMTAWDDGSPCEVGWYRENGGKPVRIVREDDYCKLMKLVRAVEFYEETGGGEDAIDALDALKGAK